jgi:NAD(P)-dependent dehydrogenase (short-subunit alcohol dehydrogenase family)
VSGRTVVATGGTGALGRVAVRAFLGAGERVVVPWIVAAERDACLAEETDACGSGQLVLVEADVAEAAGAEAVCAAAGGIDVLLNGVGGFGGGAPNHETELELWDRMYRINLRTAAAMARSVAPGMIRKSSGVILNVASQAAAAPPAGLAAYAAAKSGVAVLTRVLHQELAPHGIRANAVAPGTIDTPANRRAMPDADFRTWTPPERIADVLLWLASDRAAAVRGAVVPV